MVQFSGVIKPFMELEEDLISKEAKRLNIPKQQFRNRILAEEDDVWKFIKNLDGCDQGCKRMIDQVIANFDNSLQILINAITESGIYPIFQPRLECCRSVVLVKQVNGTLRTEVDFLAIFSVLCQILFKKSWEIRIRLKTIIVK